VTPISMALWPGPVEAPRSSLMRASLEADGAA
jgi:hypothetical protein